MPTANTHATIQQTIATAAGQAYQLTFYYSPRENDGDGDSSGMQVLWNGNVVHTLDGATPGWQQIVLTVTGTGGNDTLAFRGFGAGEQNELGAYIDHVSLQAIGVTSSTKTDCPPATTILRQATIRARSRTTLRSGCPPMKPPPAVLSASSGDLMRSISGRRIPMAGRSAVSSRILPTEWATAASPLPGRLLRSA